MLYIGELAAIITSITYAVNSALFTVAGRKVGSMVVNRVRLLAACIFLALGHWIFIGLPWPAGAGWERWLWLGSSGIVGLVLGDAFLFQAFIWIGPRISMLMMSLAPIIAAVTAWVLLEEKLSGMQIMGILVTLTGVAWVILEKNQRSKEANKDYLRGILFGLGAATGQGLGLVLAKPGLQGSFSALSGNFIRMTSAFLVMGLITILQGKLRETYQQVRAHPRALGAIVGGAFSGPFIGVSLSLFALQHTSIGVASTLVSLTPIFLLPVEARFFHERVGWGAVAGTIVALLGVAVLFLF
ncbi:MAG: DMT family transporter [Anaerolineales bacterium]